MKSSEEFCDEIRSQAYGHYAPGYFNDASCIAVINDIIKQAERRGAERMRERCAEFIERKLGALRAISIRALPISDDEGVKQ